MLNRVGETHKVNPGHVYDFGDHWRHDVVIEEIFEGDAVIE